LPVGRKIEDEREAVRCLHAAERAGLSAGEWARGTRYRRALAARLADEYRAAGRTGSPQSRRRPDRVGHALVELLPAVAPAVQGAARYVLVVGGARVEFGDDVSVATLRRVLEALRSC
jgi:hypothetical protein